MTTIVRTAVPEDIPAIIDYQQRMASETEHILLDKVLLSDGVRNLFKDSAKGQYYVAEQNGSVIGCLMISYEWSDWRNGMVWWIQSVFVHEDFRGKGVYKMMYDHIQRLASEDPGIKGIRLYVDKTNDSARRVYHKLGMNGEHYQVYEWMKSQ